MAEPTRPTPTDPRQQGPELRSLRAEFRAIFAALFFSSLLALVAAISCADERKHSLRPPAPAEEEVSRTPGGGGP